MAIMTVGDLVAELLKQDQTAPVKVAVSWSGDTAVGAVGEIQVYPTAADRLDTTVMVKGRLWGCDTTLEIDEHAPYGRDPWIDWGPCPVGDEVDPGQPEDEDD